MAAAASSSSSLSVVLRSMEKPLRVFFDKARKAVPNPETVHRLAENINNLAGNLPWLGLAVQAVTFLIDGIVTAEDNKSKLSSVLEYANRLSICLDRFKELLPDGDDSQDQNFKAITVTSLACSDAHINGSACSRQGCCGHFCGWASRVVFAKCNATQLDEVTNQLDRLNKQLDTELSFLILRRVPHPASVSPALPPILIGFHDRQKEMMDFIKKDPGRTRVVGVFGEGGIGKTTLLNAVYRELKRQQTHVLAFQEVGQPRGEHQQPSKPLVEIQQDLLCQLEDVKQIFCNTAQGQSRLEDCFKKFKDKAGKGVCLFLDNVWNSNHLEELLPAKLYDILPPSSYLLVSSRSKDVADWLGTLCSRSDEEKQQIYMPCNLQHLTHAEARELFIKTASTRGNDFLCNHEDLLKVIVDLCGGLPLALKVYGSYFGKKKYQSRAEMEKVASRLRCGKDGVTNNEEKVFATLEVSIDHQQETVRDAFLDAALYFRGMKWDEAAYALMDEDEDCLECLLDQSLVTKAEEKRWDETRQCKETHEIVAVHDLFFAIAKRRAEQKKWIYVDDSNQNTLLQQHKQEELMSKVRGINISDGKLPFWSHNNDFIRMSQLCFLKVTRFSLFVSLLPNPLTSQELRFLMLGREEEDIPEFAMNIGMMPKLTVLNVCFKKFQLDFRNQEIPASIQKLERIKSVSLKGIQNLTNLPQALSNLSTLKVLKLDGCTGLKELPSTVGNLSSLQRLDLAGCTGLNDLPPTVGNLSSLQRLDLPRCTGLKELPRTVGNLSSLQSLDLRGCTCLKELPPTVGNMSSLQRLYLSECTGLKELSPTVGNLSSLQRLDLAGCTSLNELPPTVGNLSSLQRLDLPRCTGLKELPLTVGNLSSLQSLDLQGCTGLKELPRTVGNLSSLQRLFLVKCIGLKELPPTVGNLSYLQSLDVQECTGLKELPPTVGNLSSLQSLDLQECTGLKELPPTVGNLSSLQSLYLSGCTNLKELPATVGNLISLQSLDLPGCTGLKELPATVGNLSSLQSLNLLGCTGLKELPPTVGNLSSLQRLFLLKCTGLKEMPRTVGNLSSLQRLDLAGCTDLKELPPTVGNLSSLQRLDLPRCTGLKELPLTVCNLSSLQSLDLQGCTSLKELPPTVGNLSSLQSLDLQGCTGLKELPPTVGNLSSLQRLFLLKCTGLKELPPTVGNLSSLQSLNLRECTGLKELPPTVGNLSSLQRLFLLKCTGLKELPPTVGNLSSLQRLYLQGCTDLKELPPTVDNLSSLQSLNLEGCTSLNELPLTLKN